MEINQNNYRLNDAFVVFRNETSKIYVNSETNKHTFYLETIGEQTLIKIQDVVSPIPLEHFSKQQLRQFLALTYRQLVTLDDGSHKIYFNFKMQGGMKESNYNILKILQKFPDVKDATIEDLVINNLPKKTFSLVQVYTTQHSFFGGPLVTSRVIKLVPAGNQVEAFLQALYRFFAGYEGKYKLTYNGTALGSHILGIEKSATAHQQLKQASEEKRAIYIHIAPDLKSFECVTEQNQSGTCTII